MRTPIHITLFFLTLHYAFLLYINSTFLGQFFPEESTGILYTLSSLVAIAALAVAPAVINRFRRYSVTLCLLVFTAVSALFLSQAGNPLGVGLLFIGLNAAVVVLRFLLDVYLRQYSTKKETGEIRADDLTIQNVAIAVSPFIVGMLLMETHFDRVYLAASLLLLPAIAVVFLRFKQIPHEKYDKHNIRAAASHVWQNRDLHASLIANFLLEFFYAWMVIYTPIYLHEVIGFDFAEIGAIFSFMLLPFVFFQIPFGKYADRRGEGELLAVGFFVMALFTGSLVFLHDKNMVAWALLLFMTRVGAAAVEVMSESRFFKGIEPKDANLVGIFRAMRPLALLIAPLVGGLVLESYGQNGIFVALAFLMLYGARFGMALERA
ncbi:MAG: MFS transporter [Patescibacteria group bacterium]